MSPILLVFAISGAVLALVELLGVVLACCLANALEEREQCRLELEESRRVADDVIGVPIRSRRNSSIHPSTVLGSPTPPDNIVDPVTGGTAYTRKNNTLSPTPLLMANYGHIPLISEPTVIN